MQLEFRAPSEWLLSGNERPSLEIGGMADLVNLAAVSPAEQAIHPIRPLAAFSD
jgi:hypothetical protein